MLSKVFPKLYGKSSKGLMKVWMIRAEENPDKSAAIVVEHGYEDGKMQQSRTAVSEGKNIGRSNETTPYEQACSEAESKWNKKRDKLYFPTKKELKADKTVLPMLALEFGKAGHRIKFPAYAQPKLEGIRCLAHKTDGKTVTYTSREGKPFLSMSHLTSHLLEVMNVGEYFDGELFTPGIPFETITSMVKSVEEPHPDVEQLQFWIYDIVQDKPFTERGQCYTKRLAKYGGGALVAVPIYIVTEETGVKEFHDNFVAEGFEGVIIRNHVGVYKSGPSRSANLQKFKVFIDEEFKIIGGKEGKGKAEEAVTFLCITEEGNEFEVVPKGTYEQKRKYWKELDSLIEKKLTVQYQRRTRKDNVPYLPVGIAVRDYE